MMRLMKNLGLIVSLIVPTSIIASEDVEDFSLDASDESASDPVSQSGGSEILNNVESGSDLFGNAIPDVPLTNSGPKTNSAVKPSNPVGDGLAPTPPSMKNSSSLGTNIAMPPKNNASPKPANEALQQSLSTQPSLTPTATPALTAEPMPSNTPASPQVETQLPQQAALEGDGSLAPVKQANFQPTTNEFGGVPPLPGTRRDMAPGEAPEVYDVEEGDTMFDVCSQLIDDGNYWPKLWSLNPDVSNPHFIYPGMKLVFYSGDTENPPFIEVVAEEEVVPVEKGEIKEAELVVEAEVISEAGSEGVSALPVLSSNENMTPQSVAPEDELKVVSAVDISAEADVLDGFIFTGANYSRDDVEFVVPAFLFAEEREPLATVVSGTSGQSMFGDDKTILIRPEDGLGIGTYSVLRPSGGVESARSGDFIGYRYEFAGNIRVLRRTKGELLEGVVFDTRTPIMAGDIVVNFIATKRSIPSVSSVGAVGTANSSVIGFVDAGKQLGTKGDLVFLEKTGVSAGGFYTIFKNEMNRAISHSDEDDVMVDAGSVAVVRVIEVSGESALGYIVGANADVSIGDSLSL